MLKTTGNVPSCCESCYRRVRSPCRLKGGGFEADGLPLHAYVEDSLAKHLKVQVGWTARRHVCPAKRGESFGADGLRLHVFVEDSLAKHLKVQVGWDSWGLSMAACINSREEGFS